MKENKGIGTLQGVVVVIVVIAIIAGVGAWYMMGDDGETNNGGPANGDGNGDGNGDVGPAPEVIKIGWPTSISGPLSPFGGKDQWIANKMEDYINNEMGGVMLSKYDEKIPVDILIRDTESDPKQAAQVAESLVNKDQIDLMLVQHTPVVTVPVCGISEKNDVPTISLDTPQEAWLDGAPYEWCYNVFPTWPDFMNAYISILNEIRDQTNEKIGALLPDGADGRAIANYGVPMLEDEGYEIIFTGHFPQSLQDFSSIIDEFKSQNAEIVFGNLQTPTFHRFMKQAQESNYNPKVVVMGKASLFPSAMEALGELSNGVSFELWWGAEYPYESSLTGQSPAELINEYEEDTGKQASPPLGFGHGGLEIAVDVLERAGSLDRETLRQAIAETDMETILGPVDFKDIPSEDAEMTDLARQYKEHISVTPVVGAQWVPSDEWTWEPQIVSNWKYDEIPAEGEVVFPKPWPQ